MLFSDSGPAWHDLLEESRVTVLAEAGSGKTDEMLNQVRRLRADGKFAFFFSLELIASPIESLLDAQEQELFASWLAEGGKQAWFFLDSVDQLKLSDRRLDQALLTFANAIKGRLGDARVIMSCRPSDWRPGVDMVAFERRLAIPPPPAKIAMPRDPEDFFLSTLEEGKRGSRSVIEDTDTPAAPSRAFRTVILLPMSDRQIRSFAEQLEIPACEAFLAEIDRRDAWDFARRPQDLLELAEIWSRELRLGERRDQHETDITIKLKDDPERVDAGVIDDTKAREGAERLAFALTLARKQALRAGDPILDPGHAQQTLDPAGVLPDWSPKQRQALLRRSLFDPATLGRVRFHHRSIREYLAACRFRWLREKGMSTRELLRMFADTRYGEDVVIPSRAPVAAWVALWDGPVRRMLTRLEPETLLSMGDPASLDHSVRAGLLASFATMYGSGTWRGVRIPVPELKRLAVPELAGTVLRLWGAGPTNPDVRELLLSIMWQGPMTECEEIAFSVAMNIAAPDHERIDAVRALLASKATERVAAIVADMVATPDGWSDKIVRSLGCDLFPAFLTVGDLIGFMERTPEPEGTAGGFGWAAERMIEALDDPCSSLSVDLRNRLADVIWRKRGPDTSFYNLKSECDHFTPALSSLCARQLSACQRDHGDDLVWACVIAGRFEERVHRLRGDPDPLREAFKDELVLRAAAFRQELLVMDEVTSVKDPWHRYYYAEHGSLLGRLRQSDCQWLETMLACDIHPDMKAVALQGLLALWSERGRPPEDVEAMTAACRGDAAMMMELSSRTRPLESDPAIVRAERETAESDRKRAAKKEKEDRSWLRWRGDLLADPVLRFSPAHVGLTVENLYRWLLRQQQSGDELNHWDDAVLMQAFSAQVAVLARQAYRDHWRSTRPVLWSQRPADARNSRPYSWLEGYLGICMENREPGWERRLGPDDARTAVAYATVKLNGLADFLIALTAAHPTQVDEVLGSELTAQLAVGSEHGHLPLMQDVANADESLRRLLAPHLLQALERVGMEMEDDAAAHWSHHLDQAWRILEGLLALDQVAALTSMSVEKVRGTRSRALKLAWMKGLFLLDAEKATELLEDMLVSADRSEAAEAFVQLFDDHTWFATTINVPTRARVLTRLVRCAYAVIRHEDDEAWEGIRSVGSRERREMVRNRLFSVLVETPGPETRSGLLELAASAGFSGFPDRVRFLARRRAAADAEPPALAIAEIQALEARFCKPPHDRDGLNTTMLDRLSDLAEDVAHHDFTDRVTLRSITDEVEMQRTLASRLQAMSRGFYLVSREDEVADRKRTDIRLSIQTGNVKAAIEIKMADSWSVTQLEQALRDQLLGQYLRHAHCRAGCLLLTYSGKKKRWKIPGGTDFLDFTALVQRLATMAARLEAESAGTVRLAIFGLDLTDPPLAPAHGGHAAKSRAPGGRRAGRRVPRR